MAVARASGGARLDMQYLRRGELGLASLLPGAYVNTAACPNGQAALSLRSVRLAVPDDRPVPCAAAHGGEEEQRDQKADHADDHQDQPDRRDLEPRDVRVDREVEDRADGDQ